MTLLEAGSGDEWAEVISQSFVPLSLGEAASDFRGSVEQTVLLPGVTVTDVHTYGHSVVLRTDRLIRRETREEYLLSLHLDGKGAVLQGDREVILGPGAGAVYDTTRPYRLVFPTSTRQIVLHVPRQALRDRLAEPADLCGRHLPAEAPAIRVLAGFLRELVAVSPELEPARLAEFGWTAIDLLATALRAHGGLNGPPPGRQALLRTMSDYVARHLADPDLTPGRLALAHGVSSRYVTALFAESGTSPAAFIREERLKAAHRALSDPRQAHQPIAVIGSRAGFSDRTTFTRAFIRRYGIPPAEVRAAACARDAADPCWKRHK